MFISSVSYKKAVKSIISEGGEILCAVAFWGRGAESLFRKVESTRLKIICNLRSGATNPDIINSLRQRADVTIKQHDRLHAKVILGTKTALIGSANFSTNGLNLEGEELEGWEEAGFVTADRQSIKRIRQWYKVLWNSSRDITDKDIAETKEVWEQRRDIRIRRFAIDEKGEFTLDSLTDSDLRDRKIFLAIYRDSLLSEDAKKAYGKHYKRQTSQLSGRPSNKAPEPPPMYEGWEGDLPKEGALIDLHYGPRGALKCYGAFKRTYDISFNYEDGSEGHLAVCCEEKDILGIPFGSKEQRIFAQALKPYIQKIWEAAGDDDSGGRVISLVEAVQLCRE